MMARHGRPIEDCDVGHDCSYSLRSYRAANIDVKLYPSGQMVYADASAAGGTRGQPGRVHPPHAPGGPALMRLLPETLPRTPGYRGLREVALTDPRSPVTVSGAKVSSANPLKTYPADFGRTTPATWNTAERRLRRHPSTSPRP
jgi:hypothetical protein